MRHLRYPQQPRTLWIDAVCIDQSSLEERGEQVTRMSSIYQNASRVIVWLGNGSEESDLAMCKLAYLGRQVMITKDNWLINPPGAEETYWCESACEVPYSEGGWTTIANLLGKSDSLLQKFILF
ncbi:heterokaryon incompatibility [Diaporthe sp. PMI_573]|nr:heterokaryon incompatibility [Diaporthaceae sp. PMI_573]